MDLGNGPSFPSRRESPRFNAESAKDTAGGGLCGAVLAAASAPAGFLFVGTGVAVYGAVIDCKWAFKTVRRLIRLIHR